MDRENFERLLELIVDHEVFKNRSPVAAAQQTHPRYQLAVFLLRMGGGSKSGSMTLVLAATAAGVGEGSIVNISRRVPIAILSLHDTFTHWPTREEKAVLKQCVCAAPREVFSGCVGFIDGHSSPYSTLLLRTGGITSVARVPTLSMPWLFTAINERSFTSRPVTTLPLMMHESLMVSSSTSGIRISSNMGNT
ncbi:hypothetical protein FPQ18DRAFT_123713 [Pyronema domesticum]|nr:hypothetical protein FPQ18DRAFT_123713 [Pyronema domesticum]